LIEELGIPHMLQGKKALSEVPIEKD